MMNKWKLIVLLVGALALFFTSVSGCEDSDVGDCPGAMDVCDLCDDSNDRSSCIDTFEQCSIAKDSNSIQACCDRSEEVWYRECLEEYL